MLYFCGIKHFDINVIYFECLILEISDKLKFIVKQNRRGKIKSVIINLKLHEHCNNVNFGIRKVRKSKKDRQHKGQKKRTTGQTIHKTRHRKAKRKQDKPH